MIGKLKQLIDSDIKKSNRPKGIFQIFYLSNVVTLEHTHKETETRISFNWLSTIFSLFY